MHRPALARLYRPRKFSEIVGQDHVSATLRTAVERERVAHAYLFCGPRGIGKTTAARVLAMALNCENRDGGEPCGECESCQRIWSGHTSLDVVEIDAASNRGVDDARDLRERAMYAPTEASRYKVYIIDEAHMLTREAWNAFLKILEEPPPRVIFVLATTEPGKIFQAAPPRLSRCQRFDFHRISAESIRGRLAQVLDAEGIEAEDAAIVPIARRADGALRDALSALDQVLAFSGERITGADVRQVLGLIEEDLYFELFEIIADHRAADVFGFVQRLVDGGYDLEEFYKGTGDALRQLLKVRLAGAEAGGTEPASERYSQTAERFAAGDLLRMLSALAELDTDGRFRKSEQQRILIEVLLLKFAMLESTVEIRDVLEALGGGGGAGGGGAGGGGRAASRHGAAETRPVRGGEGEAGPGSSGRESTAPERRPSGGGGGASAAPSRRQGPADPRGGSAGPASPGDGLSSSSDDRSGEGGAQGGVDRARNVWRELIAGGQVLRPGQGIALRAVQIVGLSADGALRISVPRGTPAAELLEDGVTRARLEQELSRRLGSRIRLVQAGGGPEGTGAGGAEGATDAGVVDPPPRVTREGSRAQRLARLVEDDRALQELVSKLDLELLE